MLQVKKLVFNPFLENTYIVFDDITHEAAIIDPGCYDEIERSILKKFISEKELKVKYIINTHCHLDHIFGNSYIKNIFQCDIYAPEEDLFLINHLPEQSKMFGLDSGPSPLPDIIISEEITIQLGKSDGKFLFTPGHSPGEHSLYFEKDKICFTGDVLFKQSIGRTDLEGGDYEALMNSIRTKLLVLPDDVVIYPGHEEESTIGEEKQLNPFLYN